MKKRMQRGGGRKREMKKRKKKEMIVRTSDGVYTFTVVLSIDTVFILLILS